MVLERDKVQSNLPKKGFEEVRDGDHIFYHFKYEGKLTHIRTKVSHGTKYKFLGEDLVSLMARQCKVTTKAFRGLAECTVSHSEYVTLLKNSGEV
jgi:hypothetical protein